MVVRKTSLVSSSTLSIMRPWSKGFLWLDAGGIRLQ